MAAPSLYGKGPTGEIGSSRQPGSWQMPNVLGGAAGWSIFSGAGEHIPNLQWPQSNAVYERMLTNPQVWGLYMGMVLPLIDYDIALEPGEANLGMTETLAADLGLPVGLPAPGETGPELEPGQYRFDFLQHMWDALMALAYGHSYFEQVGIAGDDTPDGLWHLKRLGPRSQHDISDILTDDDGGLKAIMFPSRTGVGRGMAMVRDAPINVDRLVAYVWLPDARRRWTGRAMLRACYEPWLLRDPLVRIDVINHDRAGGVPGVETDDTWQGGDLSELRDLASAFHVGEESGFATPPGATLKLLSGRTTDVVASIRYHDESMARAWGSMVRQLGTTATGSRALGDTMESMEAVVRRSIMRWFASTFRNHVIRDWWEINVPTVNGQLPPCPTLAWRPRDDGNVPEPEPVPEEPAVNPRQAPPSARGGAAGRDVDSRRALASRDGRVAGNGAGGRVARTNEPPTKILAAAQLPDRPLRRQPYEHEVRAAVDFAAMDLTYDVGADAVESLLNDTWLPDLTHQAEDAIAFTKTGTVRKRLTRNDAAKITIKPPDPAPLEDILLRVARAAHNQAVGELATQGVSVAGLDDVALRKLVADQAQAVAQQVADGVKLAASRRAVQVNAGRTPGEVASEVSNYLRGLKHDWEAQQLRGAVQMAQNVARLAVFAQADEEGYVLVSSEILDASTCGPCAAIDGHAFEDWAQAQRFYGSGGYVDCQGGPRCRGTVLMVGVDGEPTFAPGLGPG